jgi:hypothetical protein
VHLIAQTGLGLIDFVLFRTSLHSDQTLALVCLVVVRRVHSRIEMPTASFEFGVAWRSVIRWRRQPDSLDQTLLAGPVGVSSATLSGQWLFHGLHFYLRVFTTID